MRFVRFVLLPVFFLTTFYLTAAGQTELPPDPSPGPAPGLAVSADPFMTGIGGRAFGDGKAALFFGDGSLRVYHGFTGQERRVIRFFPGRLDLAASGDMDMDSGGRILLVLTERDRPLSRLVLIDGTILLVAAESTDGGLRLPRFVPGGDSVLAARGRSITLWDGNGTLTGEWLLPEVPSALSPRPDGKGWVAGGTGGGLYESDGGERFAVVSRRGHGSAVSALCFTESGNGYLTVSLDGRAAFHDAASGALLAEYWLDDGITSVRCDGETFRLVGDIPLSGDEAGDFVQYRISPGDDNPVRRETAASSFCRDRPLTADLDGQGLLVIGDGNSVTGKISGNRVIEEIGPFRGIRRNGKFASLLDGAGAILLEGGDGTLFSFFPGRGSGWALVGSDGFFTAGSTGPLPFVRLVPADDPSGAGLPLAEELSPRMYAGSWFRKSWKPGFSEPDPAQ